VSFAAFGAPPPDVQGRRRATAWFTAGALSVLAVVAFFWWFADRDAATLEHGERATGTIVALVQPRDWDPMDSGRVVVRYEMHGASRQSTIWLDNDISEYHVGQQVPVFVRGDHVRTDRENNDPAPLGSAAVLLGLAGVAALIRGWVVRADRDNPTTLGDATVLPLTSWRLGRRPAVEVTRDGEVRIRAPGFFGSKRMVVAASDVAVEVVSDQLSEDPFADELYFEEPLQLLDLPTRTQGADPNLVLGFARPVRVPPLRAILALQNPFPFSWRASRSVDGVFADGVLLRITSPQEAALVLESAGATRVPDVVTWLARYRQVATDPVRIAQLQAADETVFRRARYAFWAWSFAAVVLLVARITETWWALALAFAALGLGFALDKRASAAAER
jgi:hypothetical protein